jgi:hypothetical protein
MIRDIGGRQDLRPPAKVPISNVIALKIIKQRSFKNKEQELYGPSVKRKM